MAGHTFNERLLGRDDRSNPGDICETVSAQGFKIAAGLATLVSGAVTVATGLATVLSFTASVVGTGASATGVTEVADIFISSITTGAVACVGSYGAATGVRIASTVGTSQFYWTAFGT